MLFGVRKALSEGDSVSLVLRFSDQEEQAVTAEVLKDKQPSD